MKKIKILSWTVYTAVRLLFSRIDDHEYQVEIATVLLHDTEAPMLGLRDKLTDICNRLTEYGVLYTLEMEDERNGVEL